MHLEPAMEKITEPYVTRSSRQEVAPNQPDLYFILFIYLLQINSTRIQTNNK